MARQLKPVFQTRRLTVRLAAAADQALFEALWTDPRVMALVGFPHGLPLTRDDIAARLAVQRDTEFEQLLVVELKASGQAIGEAWLARPDAAGVVEPDVKLRPSFWGHRYGLEVWRALIAYQFTHTDCATVQATPNVANHASIKMQEAVGARPVGEGVYLFPDALAEHTTPVQHIVYQLSRADWERSQTLPARRGGVAPAGPTHQPDDARKPAEKGQ